MLAEGRCRPPDRLFPIRPFLLRPHWAAVVAATLNAARWMSMVDQVCVGERASLFSSPLDRDECVNMEQWRENWRLTCVCCYTPVAMRHEPAPSNQKFFLPLFLNCCPFFFVSCWQNHRWDSSQMEVNLKRNNPIHRIPSAIGDIAHTAENGGAV